MKTPASVTNDLRQVPPESRMNRFFRKLKQQKTLVFMSFPFLAWLILFKYVPLWGWLLSFQDFQPGESVWHQKWVGFKQFLFLFTQNDFLQVLRNTLAMAIIQLVLGFVTAIVLAILLNELRLMVFKRFVQTVSYMPHFLSFVVAADLIADALSINGGIFNQLLMWLGIIHKPVLWLGIGRDFWAIFGISTVWKNVGWNTIVYLAAITTIDPTLYEAAEIDGAGRFQRIWNVTIPGLKKVIVILLIMNVGFLLEQGFDLQYLLGNGMNIDYSEVIDIFSLKYGINMGNFSLATAAGVFKTVVSIILLFSANHIAKRLGEERLF